MGDLLAGIIKDVPDVFSATACEVFPRDLLLGDAAFRMAIAAPWLELPTGRSVLVLLSEVAEVTWNGE